MHRKKYFFIIGLVILALSQENGLAKAVRTSDAQQSAQLLASGTSAEHSHPLRLRNYNGLDKKQVRWELCQISDS